MELVQTVSNPLQQASQWLKQCVSALAHLHSIDLSRNDARWTNNIFLSTYTAFLSDLGSLNGAQEYTAKYGVPVIYCPPEGRLKIPGQQALTEVDGKKLDVWCLGMVAFEYFTGMELMKSVEPLTDLFPSWYSFVYPLLKERLERQNFVRLVQNAFPDSEPEFAEVVLNFIKACLNIVPENRPAVFQLQKHKLFGGTWEYDDNRISIWNYQVSRGRLYDIFKANQVQAQVLPAKSTEKCRSDDFPTSDAVSIVPVECVESPPLEKLVISGGSSVSQEVWQESTPDVSQEELAPDTTLKPSSSRRQRFRNWCREKKTAFVDLLRSCCPCRRK